MPKGEAVFYVGRVIKTGFDNNEFIETLANSKPFYYNEIVWSIIEVEQLTIDNSVFIKGELSKAKPDAKVTVLNTELSKKEEKEEPRLVQGISEFVYIPEYSGIAFRSIPNQIEPKTFIKIFAKIIENSLGNFFVECEIKMLDDLKSFYDRLSMMDHIETIKARVKPPNPLFGKLWESLKKYLLERKLDELQLKEIAKKKGINTKIKELIRLILDGDEIKIEEYISKNQISVTDLALLMSLDGYGDGRLDGKQGQKYFFIKTHEKIVHFSLPTEHDFSSIYNEAVFVLKEISDERYMEH
jgi:hypothetical protein